jgi:hypothetical protein
MHSFNIMHLDAKLNLLTLVFIMTNPSKIKQLAWQRLEEAKILSSHNKCDGAFYLAGYSVELLLKAKICEKFGVPGLFDESDKDAGNTEGIGEIRKAVKTHNLFTLLIFSGLKAKFDADKEINKILSKINSLLFGVWSESARYKPCGYYKPKDVNDLITLLEDKGGILQWIENNN